VKVVETIAELQALSRAWRAGGETVGFVPTMGALHEGHMSLVRAAQQRNARVIVSIFVNPTQFNDRGDFRNYPRDFDADLALLRPLDVDVVFHPNLDEMYPAGDAGMRVRPGPVAEPLEGEHRPGHFEGVATVVARLFNAALPDRAYFGQKDAQQVQVVRALVRDLGFPVEVVAWPTVREADGLAMSSRNQRLTIEQRQKAVALVHGLAVAQAAFSAGERDAMTLARQAAVAIDSFPGVAVEYVAIVQPDSFAGSTNAAVGDLLVLAVQLGDVRLIDNAVIGAGDLIRYRALQLQEA
jgi:pantoate--beta-alanine ligase